MIRIMQSLLALITLLLLAFMAARANSAPVNETGAAWQGAPAKTPDCDGNRTAPRHHWLTPGPQPGTRLQAQPYAYGYFGARAYPAADFHRSASGDWFQWSCYRAD